MNGRQSLIVVAAGMTNSGKSRLLWTRYVQHQPRVIHLDTNDEVCERVPGALRAMGMGQLFDLLGVAARRRARRFNIAVTGFQPGEVAELLRALVPTTGPRDSLAAGAFGSLAVECSEMGMLCKVSAEVSDALSIAMMNARHHGVSLFLATQYPYSLPAAARMNCHEVALFQMDEPQALIWARQVVGVAGAEAVEYTLRDHAFILYDRHTGLLYHCDKSGTPTRPPFTKQGAPAVDPAAPRPSAARALSRRS